MDKKFNIGDVVYVSGDVRFKDDVGEVVDLGRNADFVVVKMYADDKNRSFHASDLSIDTDEKENDREEKDDEDIEIYVAFYSEDDHRGWVGKLRKSEEDGRTKWREVRLKDEKSDKDWGGMSYMSYLSPKDLMSWVEKDYGRHYDIRGPFESKVEAHEFMKRKFSLGESVLSSIKDGAKRIADKVLTHHPVKNWDKLVKIAKDMGHATPDTMPIRELAKVLDIAKLDKIAQKMHARKFLALKLLDMKIILNSTGDVFTAKAKKMLGEELVTEAVKFKAGDSVHMGYSVRNGSGVEGTLEKIEGSYAFVKVKRGKKEEVVKGHSAYLSKSVREAVSLDNLEGLNLESCDLLEAWVLIEQLYPRDEALLIFEAVKEVRAKLTEGYGENNKDYQAWIRAVRKKHPDATITGDETKAQMVDWNTVNNKLCGEWDGKKGTVLEGTITESEFLQRMLKHVSDKRDFSNPPSKESIKAISDTKKMTAGTKKSFSGIKFKNDTAVMAELLDRAKSISRKQKLQATKYSEIDKQASAGKSHTPTKVNLKKYQDYLTRGMPVKGGKVGSGFSTSSYADDDDGGGDDGGDGRLMPTNTALKSTVENFHNFLHHIAEEELLSCKVIHFEAKGNEVIFYAECRDDPRSEGLQQDLTNKLQTRFNMHTFPGAGVITCKVIHVSPKQDKIAK